MHFSSNPVSGYKLKLQFNIYKILVNSAMGGLLKKKHFQSIISPWNISKNGQPVQYFVLTTVFRRVSYKLRNLQNIYIFYNSFQFEKLAYNTSIYTKLV